MGNSNYSLKERMVAKILSNMPFVKRMVKDLYITLNAAMYKKNYIINKIEDSISSPEPTIRVDNFGKEFFFGYYDKSAINASNWIINHVTSNLTAKSVANRDKINIVLSNRKSDEVLVVEESSAYNWQQGARAQWIDNDRLIFNDYDEKNEKWISKVYSLKDRKLERIFDHPVQDSFGDKYFLSLSYKRLNTTTEDYGYHNQGKLTEQELYDLDNDGITILDFISGSSRLLVSFRDIINLNFEAKFNEAIHTVNHIMINKSGKKFMFIHRYYVNGVRKDRLMCYDFTSLKLISDYGMVSHCCWFDDDTIYGYLRYNEVDGYYFINIQTLEFRLNDVVASLGLGDGHPSVHEDLIVFDTYPDRSRMQSLYLYNNKTAEVRKLLEVFQSTKYKNASRCDLHPRFSPDGGAVFFDSVYQGKRNQYFINL